MSGVIAPLFLTLALDGGEWSASPLFTEYVGAWLGPRGGLGFMENRRISWSYQELNPDSSVVQPLAKSLYQLR
jgi:hypothetical protein